jgi:hypothetical protein
MSTPMTPGIYMHAGAAAMPTVTCCAQRLACHGEHCLLKLTFPLWAPCTILPGATPPSTALALAWCLNCSIMLQAGGQFSTPLHWPQTPCVTVLPAPLRHSCGVSVMLPSGGHACGSLDSPAPAPDSHQSQ